MKLSIVVAVILRMFAIVWMVNGIFSLATSFHYSWGKLGQTNSWASHLLPFIQPGAYLLFACVAWVFAAGVTRMVVGKNDPHISVPEIGTANLYSLGFLIVGLTYCLDHLGASINWIHYYAVSKTGDDLMGGSNDRNFYELSRQIIPCVAGAALALMSPQLGRKMARAVATENQAAIAPPDGNSA
jgi:hypothetical protein